MTRHATTLGAALVGALVASAILLGARRLSEAPHLASPAYLPWQELRLHYGRRRFLPPRRSTDARIFRAPTPPCVSWFERGEVCSGTEQRATA